MKGRNWIQAIGIVILATLLLTHIFHLYSAWKRSVVPIVDVSYVIFDALPELGRLHNSLNKRLHMEDQFVDKFTPVIFASNKVLSLSFAVRDEKRIDGILHDIEKEVNTWTDPLNCRVAAEQQKKEYEKKIGHVRQLHASIRFLPWVKPLDIVVLLILSGALGVWIRMARDT